MEMNYQLDLDALLPAEGDVAGYREHGFWISPVIIPGEVLDAAERGMERFYAGERDLELPGAGAAGLGGWTPADGADHSGSTRLTPRRDPEQSSGLRKNDYSSLVVRELADLVTHPAIGACAARLSGSDTIRLWHDQLLYKPVDRAGMAANVGWHTDRQYWLSCTSDEMLTAWVAFHDVDEANGTISLLDGSHRWDVDGLDFFSQNMELRSLAEKARVRPAAMRRGQVSFHHCRTVHGSGPNHGTGPRRSLAIHLQPGDNRWRRHVDPAGNVVSHGNDQLVRHVGGQPDYADPRVCPQLWPSHRELV